jgi:hypothetical protein
MSNFSNNSSGSNQQAIFKKHHTHEVVKDLTESKLVAQAYSNTHRYQHRAVVSVVGHATLRPYDPIYLDGLPNGMSGYWTVLSIKHVFGGALANYMMLLEVGTDVIGDTDKNASSRSDTRDIQNDFAGQSLDASDSGLTEYELSPNASTLNPTYGVTKPTAVKKSSAVSVPTVAGSTPFKNGAPNTGNVKQTVQWSAKSSGKVLK